MDDEPSEATPADSSRGVTSADGGGDDDGLDGVVVAIAPQGDVVLRVLLDGGSGGGSSTRTGVNGSRRKTASSAAQQQRTPCRAFRVDAAALKARSRYFANLLGDTRFYEARTVEAALAALALEHVRPADADVRRLPRVTVAVDDEGSGGSGGGGGSDGGPGSGSRRERVFAELLRILHWDGGVLEGVAADAAAAKTTKTTAAAKAAGAPKAGTARTASSKTASSRTAPSKASPRPKGARSDAAQASAPATPPPPPPPPPLLPGSSWSAKTPPTLLELAILARQADRFACTGAVGAYVRRLRLRFPQPVLRAGDPRQNGGSGSGSGLPGLANEDAIRQKVYVAWLLDLPLRFHVGTRELILHGSRRWAAEAADSFPGEAAAGNEPAGAWWDLPDGLESELQFRRACIVNCLASVPRHFLAQYASRSSRRQCSMGYESSAACDSFQLGEMVKFLVHKGLLFLQDFSGTMTAATAATAAGAGRGSRRRRRVAAADYAAVDLDAVLAALRQCPAYQLDKHHVNCGLRTRILPILEYVQAMLTASAVAVHRHEWAAPRHGQASWLAAAEAAGLLDDDASDGDEDDDDDDESDAGGSRVPRFGKPRPAAAAAAAAAADRHRPQVFRFTRSVASDVRLRLEGSVTADRMARQLFTARRWDWTPDEQS